MIKQIKKLDMNNHLDQGCLAEVTNLLESIYIENIVGMNVDNFIRVVDSSSDEVINESFGASTFYTGKVDEFGQESFGYDYRATNKGRSTE